MKISCKKSTKPRMAPPHFTFGEKRKILRAIQKRLVPSSVQAVLYAMSDAKLGRRLKIELRRALLRLQRFRRKPKRRRAKR